MESNFDDGPKHAQPFREKCAENFDAAGAALITIIFNTNGAALATRTISMSAGNPYLIIDYEANNQRYELKETPSAGAEIFTDGLDKDGKRLLTKVDSNSEEFKSAKASAGKIPFDSLPSCDIVLN